MITMAIGSTPQLSLTTPSSLSSDSGGATSTSISFESSSRQRKRNERRIEYLKANSTAWTDVERTSEAMSKRTKRAATQMAQDVFVEKADWFYYNNQYKFKEATLELAKNRMDANKHGQRGSGIRAIVKRINDEKLPSPNDKKLTRGAVFNAVDRGDIGVSPLKRGVKETVTPLVTTALATQATMMQICAEGEASAPKMKATAAALIAGTNHKFSAEYAWRKTRMRHPKILNPVKAKNHEDRRVEWLTYENIIEWNARAKKFLIDIGMVKDAPGLIRKLLVDCGIVKLLFLKLLTSY